jgi:drug/metabolite transporter (DMT)-like permease
MILYAPGMKHLGMAMVAVGALLGAGGVFVFFTERGVANEIKGFVLLLIAAVLAVGGCVLAELRAIREKLGRDSHPR